MPDPDLQAAETDTDDFSDLVYEEEAPVEQAEEQVEEEATEPSEEPEGQAEAPPETDDVPDLSQFPEDLRETVKKYTDTHVGRLQKTWQDKLEEAANLRKQTDELTKKAAIVDQFNARVEKDPEAVLRELQEMVRQRGHPEDPGQAPDMLDDPAAFQKWLARKEEFRDWREEQRLAAVKAEYEERLTPIQQTYERAQAEQALHGIKQSIGANDDEWSEIVTMQKDLASDNLKAVKAVQKLVRLRKGATQKTAKAVEKIRGSEDRPGLPRTGPRAKPKPTGDAMADALAELAAEGVEYPDD